MEEVVIVAGTRTPIGRAFKGALKEHRPDDLLAHVINGALGQVPSLETSLIEDVVVGCAQPAGEAGYNMARVAGLLSGLSGAGGTTVNRYCASSLQGLRMAYHAIAAGELEAMVVAGVETVSRFGQGKSDGMPDTKNPKFAKAQARSEARSGENTERWQDSKTLADIYISMGQTAENVAQYENIGREEMDDFAMRSQSRAVAGLESGFFKSEITPVDLGEGGGLAHDECIRPGTKLEKLATLKPVFRPDGKVTAGNACPLNDGAVALVVTSRSFAQHHGLKPRAKIIGSSVSGVNPEIMGLGPVSATQRLLKRLGKNMGAMDLVEMNEAFAAQVIPCAKHLEIPGDKLNIHGGAIALGHPFGMTGARLILTLMNGLKVRGGRFGLATLCVGGGQGMSMVIENLQDA
ncbi:MAG: acetyl-CoA C-acyltransferase [Myxococcota bacterium]|nr:acetyl-CoA C-acyltransferase [Myxococcota bacterium]